MNKIFKHFWLFLSIILFILVFFYGMVKNYTVLEIFKELWIALLPAFSFLVLAINLELDENCKKKK